jgi:hypothetical protein
MWPVPGKQQGPGWGVLSPRPSPSRLPPGRQAGVPGQVPGCKHTLSKRTWLLTFSFSLPLDHFCKVAGTRSLKSGAAR